MLPLSQCCHHNNVDIQYNIDVVEDLYSIISFNIMSGTGKFYLLRKIEGFVRERIILKKHRRVARFWNKAIRSYFDGQIKKYSFVPLREFPENEKIIWQYWGQGMDNEVMLPEVVRICFASVDKYKGEYQVIRLSDNTIKEYIHFPDFIWKRMEDGQLSRTFLSDLLRLALLSTYGGVWLDATILLTAPLPKQYAEPDYFLFQRDDKEVNRRVLENPFARYWGWKTGFRVRMLSSIIFAKKGNEVIRTLQDLMLYHWEIRDHASTYFFFQILYNELMDHFFAEKRCPLVSDFLPHALQEKILNPSHFTHISFRDILHNNSIHKMTYYKDDAAERFYSFVREYTHFEV